MHITKMQGLGNDYIYLNCLGAVPEDLPGLAVRLSDRHFGVGGDGLIAIRPGVTGDFSMDMYNADGSRGAMCGNGIRCVGKYVYDKGLTRKTCLTIDSGAGPRALELHLRRGRVDQVTVDMGEPRVLPSVELEAEGEVFSAWPVEVGNPHAVIFCPDPREVPLERVGPVLERSPLFPAGVKRGVRRPPGRGPAGRAGVGAGQRPHPGLRHRGLRRAGGGGQDRPVRPESLRPPAGGRAGAGLAAGGRAHPDDRPGGHRI